MNSLAFLHLIILSFKHYKVKAIIENIKFYYRVIFKKIWSQTKRVIFNGKNLNPKECIYSFVNKTNYSLALVSSSNLLIYI
jgi:hypothetical protein